MAESGAVPCDARDGGCGELPSTLCAPSAPPSREARIAYFGPSHPLNHMSCTPCLRGHPVPGARPRHPNSRRTCGWPAPQRPPQRRMMRAIRRAPPPFTTLESAPYSTAPSERHQGWRRRRSVERVSHLQGTLMGSCKADRIAAGCECGGVGCGPAIRPALRPLHSFRRGFNQARRVLYFAVGTCTLRP